MLPFFVLVSFFSINLRLIFSFAFFINKPGELKQNTTQRKLDSAFQSVKMNNYGYWHGLGVRIESDDSDSIYFLDEWAIFISSNETLLNSGDCDLFLRFPCSSQDCLEDSSEIFSQNYSQFSIYDATRLNLKTQEISIANGAWKLNATPFYVHSCKFNAPRRGSGQTVGQIGLGLSGKGYQNFLTPDPIFSIIFSSQDSAEIVFGFNSTYVNDTSTGITLPCDLDWKIQVHGLSVGDTIISNSPAVLIFDLQTLIISLPPVFYYSLKTQLFKMTSFTSCFDDPKFSHFTCFYIGNLEDLPPLVFNLGNGTQLALYPVPFFAPGAFHALEFELHDTTLSGVDYITLSRLIMSQYYTVFQKVENEAPTITLYPTTSKSGARLIYNQENSDVVPVSSEVESSDIQIEQGEESDHPFIEIAIVVVFVVGIFASIAYICWNKRGRSEPEEVKERHKSNLELNESTHFVSSNDSVNCKENSDLSE